DGTEDDVPALTDGANETKDNVFPATFDLRDGETNGFGESLVTSVKDQCAWRTCWGFGVISAAESSIIAESDYWTAENLDLSELQLAWFAWTPLPDDLDDPQAGEGVHFVYYDAETGEYYDIDDAIGSYRLDVGGQTTLATSVLASGTGPILEEFAPYRGKNGLIEYFEDGTWWYSPDDDWSLDEELRCWYNFELENTNILPDAAGNDPEGVEAIKRKLMQGRAVTAAYCSDQSVPGQEQEIDYINTDTWAHYTYGRDTTAITHLVCIVGWDDDYSRYLFDPNLTNEDGSFIAAYFDDEGELNEAGQAAANWDRIPDGNGAWIVKNSWGSATSEEPNNYDWGIDGYFYLSYYDTTICSEETYDFDIAASEGEGLEIIIDEYDLMTAFAYLGPYASDYGAEEIVMANVFTASDHQMLRTVGVITAEPDTTVAVQVYRLNADAEDPTDGTPLLETPATTTFEYSGYHRVGLRDYGDEDEAFAVDAGERFSVVVRMSIEDDTYVSAGASFSIQCLDETEGINWYAVGVINEVESYVV
ncbi:MAG: lectin like domain-containing protein, partial [Oscillospiraceae bacterium]|nr:lectin like domain-containing protein [Oscillospiraceae bacterium]